MIQKNTLLKLKINCYINQLIRITKKSFFPICMHICHTYIGFEIKIKYYKLMNIGRRIAAQFIRVQKYKRFMNFNNSSIN